jgi:hypothetical protein
LHSVVVKAGEVTFQHALPSDEPFTYTSRQLNGVFESTEAVPETWMFDSAQIAGGAWHDDGWFCGTQRLMPSMTSVVDVPLFSVELGLGVSKRMPIAATMTTMMTARATVAVPRPALRDSMSGLHLLSYP